ALGRGRTVSSRVEIADPGQRIGDGSRLEERTDQRVRLSVQSTREPPDLRPLPLDPLLGVGHRFLERGHLRVEVGDLRGRSNQLLLNRLLARAQVVGIDRLRDAAGHDNKYEYQPANMRLPPWPPVIAPVVGGGHHSRSAGLPAKTRTPPTVPPLARR